MFFKQYYLQCLAHASYLIGDEETKTAIVVDPQRDIEQYLKDAAEHGFSIQHVFLTHFHADFVAGHLELREKTGAEIHLGAKASAEYPVTPAKDGDSLQWGNVKLSILETPGHTPEGISIVVTDLAKGDQPYGVLTGDTLFIGDVGRPDLMASVGVTADELAGSLYDSLRNKLMPLPDETLVYPAHGAGSMCGKNLSSETFSTLGEQKANNHALQPMSREAFITMSTTGLPDAPGYFAYDATLNRKERPILSTSMAKLSALSLDSVLSLAATENAQLLDVRQAEDFAAGHLRGSINIGLGGQFATWAGTLLAQDRPIILIADPGAEAEATMRLGRIGFDHIAGFLDGGMAALANRRDLVRMQPRVASSDLAAGLKSKHPPILLDVRGPGEWETEHVDGATHIPLPKLQQRLDELPKDREIVTMCRSGYRSSTAASLLARAGFEQVTDQIGGILAWKGAQDGADCSLQ